MPWPVEVHQAARHGGRGHPRRHPEAAGRELPLRFATVPAGQHQRAAGAALAHRRAVRLLLDVQIGADGGGQGFPAGFRLTANETTHGGRWPGSSGQGVSPRPDGDQLPTPRPLHDNIEQVLDGGSVLFQKQGVQWGMRQGPFRFWPGGQGVSMASQQQGSEAAHNGVADIRSARYT